mgnify:CR=1 FL=1
MKTYISKSEQDTISFAKDFAKDLKKGDIITFQQEGRTISHRILNITKEKGITKFETKGDNNEIPDPDLVEQEQIYGKVLFRIKKVGKIISYIQNARGFINIAIFAVIVYILVTLKDKQRNIRKMKRKKYEIKKMRDNYHL